MQKLFCSFFFLQWDLTERGQTLKHLPLYLQWGIWALCGAGLGHSASCCNVNLFFFLLVYFNSQILLIVVRVRGIMHVWFLESDIYFQNILTLVEHNQALMKKGSQCEINGIPSDVQRIFFCILNKSHVLVLKSSLWKSKLRLILM